MEKEINIGQYIARHFHDQLSAQQQQELEEWLAQSVDHQQLLEQLQSPEWLSTELEKFDRYNEEGLYNRLTNILQGENTNRATIRRISFVHKWRWVAAAILMLAIGAGVYYLNNQSSKLPVIIGGTGETRTTGGDVAPGTNRAILTLSNGTQKELTLADNGLQLQSDAVLLTTPNGGQYQAVLPDGSKVWLNAASSIKFPSKFNNKERRVEITGEVYFEIAKDATRPFKVTAGEQEIEVLGTSFNINIYDNEPVKKTTLLTGKIRISVGAALVAAQNPTNDTTRATTRVAPTNILQPNEQLQIAGTNSIKKINLENGVDIIAWKNGLFNFQHKPLNEAMRQLERWYDVEVIYEPGVSTNETINGKMERNLTLSQALKILQSIGINFEWQGKKIIIKPS